ncbi:MAG: glycosyltransferase family 2 protein [Pseudomonadota bacterium]
MSAPFAVVLPHHSRRDLLRGAIAAAGGAPVLLVDDSRGGLPPSAVPPGVRLLRTDGERGFAAACNLGLAAAEAAGFSHALLLNDDARPGPGCVAALQAALASEPRAAAAGPVLIGADGEVESAGLSFGALGVRVRQRTRPPAAPTPVEALSGACLLLESSLRLDEGYRFGFEDLDLGRRLRAAGRLLLIVPAARCLHLGGGTLPRNGREAARHALTGHLRLVGDRPWRRGLVLALAVAQVLREGGPAARLAGLRDGWRDARPAASTTGSQGGKFVS